MTEVRPFDVDMPAYLSRHDIVYLSPPYEGFEGLPLGNGDLGAMIWNTPRGLELQINKTDTWDGRNTETACGILRSCARLSIDFGLPCFEWLHLEDFRARLSLHRAEAEFSAVTPFSRCRTISFIAAGSNCLILRCRVEGAGEAADGAVAQILLERWGSRVFPGWYSRFEKDPGINLGGASVSAAGSDICIEEELAGMSFAAACRVIGLEVSADRVSAHCGRIEIAGAPVLDFSVVIAVVTTNESDTPRESALALLDTVQERSIDSATEEHRNWWSAFWDRSFVHIGDDYIENLYYLKRYLMGSGSRGMYPVLFNGGIWTWNRDVRNWNTPHHWNMQQAYWGLCAQNDCDLLTPYLDSYWRIVPNAREHAKMRGAENAILISEGHDYHGTMAFWDRTDMLNNFTPASQIAGFFWEYYRYTGDGEFLRTKGYPFMKMAAEFYLRYLTWDEDASEFFIYPSQPYECPGGVLYRNPITDRVMIESLFGNCIDAAVELGCDEDKIGQWRHVINHLWPIELMTQSDGTMLPVSVYAEDGSPTERPGGTNYHFSPQSSAVFPGNLIGAEGPESELRKAIETFIKGHPSNKNAISPDPIVAARLGMAADALRMLSDCVRRLQHFPQGLFYNIDHWYELSRYRDEVKDPALVLQRDYVYDRRCGYPNGLPAVPFIQCGLEPLGILGAAVNEMLLQSWDDVIRVFPAVPEDWETAFTLLAAGGFIVSAEKKGPAGVRRVTIRSTLGNPCTIVPPWPLTEGVKVVSNGDMIEHEVTPDGKVSFHSAAGTFYILTRGSDEIGDGAKGVTFSGTANEKPKRFREAILGKERNF